MKVDIVLEPLGLTFSLLYFIICLAFRAVMLSSTYLVSPRKVMFKLEWLKGYGYWRVLVGFSALLSAIAAFSLVLTIIVLHDAMRVKGASQAQKAVLDQLVAYIPQAGSLQRGMTSLLTSFAHQPFHVAMGALYGLLFALATGTRGN